MRRPSIVHTHMAKAGTLGRLAASSVTDARVIHTFHGHVLEGYFGPAREMAFGKIERYLATRSDALIAVSSQVRDQLLDMGIGRPSQWRVIPLGIDLEPFVAHLPPMTTARSAFGLPQNVPAVGIVGRLVAIKDLETFLRAATRVASAEPDAIFVIAGDGPLRSALESLAARILPGRARFLGWVSELAPLYAALDVVALSSRNEGTPVALIEAAASQRPVVATDVGGVREVVMDGETGHLVPPGDAEMMARKIISLLQDRQSAHSMGQRAMARAISRFSSTRQAADMADLYDELLGRI